MDYIIKLTDGTEQIVKIIATTYKRLKVWKLEFSGKEIMLYKVGSEWLQRTEDYLEQRYVSSIGAFIDSLESGSTSASIA